MSPQKVGILGLEGLLRDLPCRVFLLDKLSESSDSLESSESDEPELLSPLYLVACVRLFFGCLRLALENLSP